MEKQAKKSKIEPVHIEESARLKALFDERVTVSQLRFGEENELGSQGNVWQYLNARSALNIEAALKFAKGIGCSVADFSPRLASALQAGAPGPDPTQGAAAVAVQRNDADLPVEKRIAYASTAVVSILRAAGLNDLCFGDIKTIKAIMKNGPQETFAFEEILRAALRVFVEKRELIADMNEAEFAETLLAHLRAERDVIRRTKKE